MIWLTGSSLILRNSSNEARAACGLSVVSITTRLLSVMIYSTLLIAYPVAEYTRSVTLMSSGCLHLRPRTEVVSEPWTIAFLFDVGVFIRIYPAQCTSKPSSDCDITLSFIAKLSRESFHLRQELSPILSPWE